MEDDEMKFKDLKPGDLIYMYKRINRCIYPIIVDKNTEDKFGRFIEFFGGDSSVAGFAILDAEESYGRDQYDGWAKYLYFIDKDMLLEYIEKFEDNHEGEKYFKERFAKDLEDLEHRIERYRQDHECEEFFDYDEDN